MFLGSIQIQEWIPIQLSGKQPLISSNRTPPVAFLHGRIRWDGAACRNSMTIVHRAITRPSCKICHRSSTKACPHQRSRPWLRRPHKVVFQIFETRPLMRQTNLVKFSLDRKTHKIDRRLRCWGRGSKRGPHNIKYRTRACKLCRKVRSQHIWGLYCLTGCKESLRRSAFVGRRTSWPSSSWIFTWLKSSKHEHPSSSWVSHRSSLPWRSKRSSTPVWQALCDMQGAPSPAERFWQRSRTCCRPLGGVLCPIHSTCG